MQFQFFISPFEDAGDCLEESGVPPKGISLGGVRGGNKVSWLKWSVVCKAKNKGGLGVRDVRLVNLSLLTKWRWRILQSGRPLWKEVLVANYGDHILHRVDWSDFRTPTYVSHWWKDICALEKVVESKNWFVESVPRKLSNGNSSYYWISPWIGEVPLSVAFPRLFSLSNQKNNMVIDFRDIHRETSGWSFSWRRELFQWESDLIVRLREVLKPVVFSSVEDV
jgi:hypothetical protein